MTDNPLLRALLGFPQQAQQGADWLYSEIGPTVDRINRLANYYMGPHLSQAAGNVTSLAGLLSPAGGGQDALSGSAEASRGLLGGNLAQTLHGGGEMGLGLLGMVPGMAMATKATKIADFSDVPLTKIQQALARELGAKKVGEGKAYNEYGRRADGGDKSRYYQLPDGREVRISSHADVNGGNSHFDLVIDPASGEATLATNPLRGMDPRQKSHSYEFSRDNPSGINEPLDPSGVSYGSTEHGYGGDASAWTEAIRKALLDAAKGGSR